MKATEFRTQSTEELNIELTNLKEELFNLRFQHATGQLDNPLRIREVKKDYARVKTILREREINAANA
jgi:large subunit ribosomal protein L29